MENIYVTAIENHDLLQNFFHRTQHAGPNVSFISNFRLKWSSITEKLRSQRVKGKKKLIPYKNTLI